MDQGQVSIGLRKSSGRFHLAEAGVSAGRRTATKQRGSREGVLANAQGWTAILRRRLRHERPRRVPGLRDGFPTSVPPPFSSEASVPEDEDDEMFIRRFQGGVYPLKRSAFHRYRGAGSFQRRYVGASGARGTEARASGHEARIACLKALRILPGCLHLDGSNFERDLAWFRDAIKGCPGSRYMSSWGMFRHLATTRSR